MVPFFPWRVPGRSLVCKRHVCTLRASILRQNAQPHANNLLQLSRPAKPRRRKTFHSGSADATGKTDHMFLRLPKRIWPPPALCGFPLRGDGRRRRRRGGPRAAVRTRIDKWTGRRQPVPDGQCTRQWKQYRAATDYAARHP